MGIFEKTEKVARKLIIVIKKKKKSRKLEIDLTGPQGNAFYILGIAKKLCQSLGKDWKDIGERMQSGDYEKLISVFDNEFGDCVTLYR